MPRTGSLDTADRILDVAERLLQVRGFNGFSYADIASELHVRNASIHYHFPTKSDLGTRLIARYQAAFRDRLDAIERGRGDARWKLRQYTRLYAKVLKDRNRMCLCGMLASDFQTLPRPVREGVRAFFDENEAWLARVLEQGRTDQVLRFDGPAHLAARLVLSSLEGAMLVARSYDDVARFESVAQRVVADLGGGPPRGPRPLRHRTRNVEGPGRSRTLRASRRVIAR